MSKFLSLNTKDFIKGFAISIAAVALTAIAAILQSGQLPTMGQLKVIGVTAVAAGISYLVKNLLTNSDNQFAKKETDGK